MSPGIHLGIGINISDYRQSGGLWVPADQTNLIEYWDPANAATDVWDGELGTLSMQMGTTSGADTNDPTPVTDGDPPRVDFDGNDVAYIIDSNQAGHETNIKSITYLAIAKLSDAGASSPIIAGRKASNSMSAWQYALRLATSTTPDRREDLWGEGSTYRWAGTWTDLPANMTGGDWFFIGGSADFTSPDQRYYENGAQVGLTRTYTDRNLVDTAFWSVGAAPTTASPIFSNWLNGSVGHVMIYSGRKTPAEMLAIYNDLKANFNYGLP
jgi:hypothetical protein